MENETVVNYEELNFFQKVIGLFYKPRKTFEAIKRDESIALPITLGLVAFVISYLLIIFLVGDELITNEIEKLGMKYEDIYYYIYIFGSIGASIVYFIILSIESLEMFIISKIFHGEGTYTKYMAYLSYINIFLAVGTIVDTVVSKVAGLKLTGLSLAMFAGDMDITSIIYKLLSFISVFGIWGLILKAKCIAVEEEFKGKKEYTVLAIMAIISLAITLL